MGVRMALGARRQDVRRLVLGQGLRLTMIGVGIGAIGAVVLNRLLAAMVYGIVSFEIVLLLSTTAFITGTGLLASYVPSWRATRADPVASLRSD